MTDLEKFVLGTETHVEEAQVLVPGIVGQGRRWRKRVDRRVAHWSLLVPTPCHNRMVVHIAA